MQGRLLATTGWLLALFCALGADRALAYGAVAESYWEGENGAFSHNLAANVNKETAEAARNDAMNECKSMVKQDKVRAPCKITGEFQDKCIAYAYVSDNKKGNGWALASNKGDAEKAALAKCRDVAEGSNARNCKIHWSTCDKVERPAPQPEPAQPTPSERPAPPPAPMVSDSQTPSSNSLFLVRQKQYEEVMEAARFATYVSYGVAVATFLAVGGTLWWASQRIKSLQSAAAGVRQGLTGMFTRQSSSRMSGAPVMLTPVGGGPPLALDARRLRRGGLIAGRNDGCDIVLSDMRASGRHVRFWMDDAGTLRVEDLGSSNGTWRNGQKVLKASIRPGDVLKIGDSEYQL